MNLASYCYVPAIPRLNPDAFLRNLRAYKSTYPIHLFSEEPEDGWERIDDPSRIKSSGNKVAINNIAFLHAIRMAERDGVERFIYLELDCRVHGDGWDGAVFDEASQYKDMFAAGCYATYNRKMFTPAQAVAVDLAIAASVKATGFPVPEFNASTHRPLGCLFIMGGGGCYSTAICAELFQNYERDMFSKAVKVPAFDLQIALRCHQLFQAKAPQKLPFLTSVFSSYSNKVNTEKDRIEMVKTGRWSVVHQIKSANDCLT